MQWLSACSLSCICKEVFLCGNFAVPLYCGTDYTLKACRRDGNASRQLSFIDNLLLYEVLRTVISDRLRLALLNRIVRSKELLATGGM